MERANSLASVPASGMRPSVMCRAWIGVRVSTACVSILCVSAGCASANFDAEKHAGLNFEHAVGSGTDHKPPLSPRSSKAAASPSQAEVSSPSVPTNPQRLRTGSLPDPDPLETKDQWEYEFRYQRGVVSVQKVRQVRLEKPVETARRMGRFAVELWIGRELIDRVRFNFPLLGADPEPGVEGQGQPSLSNLTVDTRVRVPHSPRATRAVLVDRAKGTEQLLPWPPDRPLGPPDQTASPAAASR